MRIAAIILVASLALPAAAQKGDPLCATLDKAIASAAEDPPFVPLVAGFKAEDKWGPIEPKPAGLEDAERCEIYLAGTAKLDVLSGGETNEYGCRLARSDRNSDLMGYKKVEAARDAMAPRVKACLVPKGWTADPPAVRQSGSTTFNTYRFSKPKSEIDVVVLSTAEQTGRSAASANTWYEAKVMVRVLNPTHPGYRKPE